MVKRKALFLDLDGTIFDNNNEIIPATTVFALNNIKDNVDLYLATGRSIFTLEPIEQVLALFKGLILLNGQHVVYRGETIHFNPLEPRLVKSLSEIAALRSLPIAFVAADQAYVFSYSNDILQYFAQRANQKLVEWPKPLDLSIPFAMGWLFSSVENIDWLQSQLPELDFIKWGKFGADIVMAGESKKTGIEIIIKKGHYDYEDTYAVGNGDNDLNMFGAVNISVAMGNSPQNVKEKASIVTDSVAEDGLFKALRNLGLLK